MSFRANLGQGGPPGVRKSTTKTEEMATKPKPNVANSNIQILRLISSCNMKFLVAQFDLFISDP